MLAAFYGLRRSEALGLKWSNIDFQTKTISISHKVVEANVNGTFQPKGFDRMKNQSSNRMLPLIRDVENELLYHRKQQKMNAAALRGAYCHEYDDYVCTDSMGKLLRPNYISVQFGKILKSNGFRHIRYHDLRHTCASLYAEAYHVELISNHYTDDCYDIADEYMIDDSDLLLIVGKAVNGCYGAGYADSKNINVERLDIQEY